MKRLVARLIIFFIPIVVLLYIWPVTKRSLYAGLSENCANHAIWMYDRIHLNTKPIHTIFLGTSHTMNAIEDSYIDSITKKHVINMGYCQFGVNLYHTLLKEIIENKKPSRIILEVRDNEDRYSHPVFPYVANTKDVLLESLLFNPDYLSDNYRHIYYKWEIIRKNIFNEIQLNEVQTDDYGCKSYPDTVDVSVLNTAKANWQHREMDKEEGIESWFYMKFPRSYYKKIAALCKTNHIDISFLYLPTYGEPYQLPAEHRYYEQYGNILMPPDSIFRNINFWVDENHLNKAGAKALSDWVAKQL